VKSPKVGSLLLLSCFGLLSWSLAAQQRVAILHKHDQSLGFYDAKTAKLMQRVEVGLVPHEMALTKDGKKLYITNYGVRSYTDKSNGGNTLHIVDVRQMKLAQKLELPKNTRPHGIERGASGKFYLTTDFPPSLVVLDPKENRIVENHALDGKLPHMLAVTRRAYRF
jgi:DNA-binding beta-propeller fold protein YncE